MFMYCELLSTLTTFQEHVCEGNELVLDCPHGTIINIQFAQFGRQVSSHKMCPDPNIDRYRSTYMLYKEDTNCLASTSLKVLLQKCQDKRYCTVLATTETFGQEPCSGTTKYLKVAFKCRPAEFSSETVCEGEQLNLYCDKPQRLAIYNAFFGRSLLGSPDCHTSKPVQTECHSSGALHTVMKRCHGKRECVIEAEDYLFKNHCPAGVQKYLNIIYTCVKKRILKQWYRHSATPPGRSYKKKKHHHKLKDNPIDHETSSDIPKQSTHVFGNLINTKRQPSIDVYHADDALSNGSRPPASPQTNSDDMKVLLDTKANLTLDCDNKTVVATGSTKEQHTRLFANWLNAFHFLGKNREKAILYMAIGVCLGLIIVLLAVVIKLMILNKRHRRAKLDVTEPTHSQHASPSNHLEAPVLERADSLDRIEVVRFSPRGTLRTDPGNRSLSNYYG
ncbi:hypothetical protein ScPMuIL_011878 [Solemya velum]